MRTDKCTFTELLASLTVREWQDLYLHLAAWASSRVPDPQRPGPVIAAGQAAGLRSTDSVRNKLQEGADYVVKALKYFESDNEPRRWQSFGHLKANVWEKTKNLIKDDQRHANSVSAMRSSDIEASDERDVHENVYQFPDARPFEESLRQSPRKQNQDALRLWNRCRTDPNATTISGSRVSFKEKYIAAAEGWTLDEYRHARKQLIARGEEFMSAHLAQQEKMPGFVFLEAVGSSRHAAPKRVYDRDGE